MLHTCSTIVKAKHSVRADCHAHATANAFFLMKPQSNHVLEINQLPHALTYLCDEPGPDPETKTHDTSCNF